MFKLFAGDKAAAEASWPVASIIETLQSHYPGASLLGEDGPLKVYGVDDNGVRFVVALMQSSPNSGDVIEVGFLARFVGFNLSLPKIEALNRNLHVSVASMEGADLFLMAGLRVTGPYDAGMFSSELLNPWRRDLMMTLHSLSDDSASLAEAFPAAKLAAARDFAVNAAPVEAEGEGKVMDLLSSFLGGQAETREVCEECNGRGKRGLIARMCMDCDGTGFVASLRR